MGRLFIPTFLFLLLTGCGTFYEKIEEQRVIRQRKVEEQRLIRERRKWVSRCHAGAKFFYSKQGAWDFCRCTYYEWSEGDSSPIEAGINCMERF